MRREVVIGRDLRASSAGIAATVATAAAAAGLTAIDCGPLPTPALALEAARRGSLAVMVTGSHIPDDRNGLKFYRPDGEITKADEAAILGALGDIADPAPLPAAVPAEPEPDAIARYRRRYLDVLAPDILAGLTIAVYQQSSVARDVLVDVLSALGADAVPIGRSETFVPIDTEAHRPQDVAFIREAMASGAFDALVTTDGDADRPLVADARGRILRGDVLGLITARYLGADAVVVPVTAGSAIERAGGFRRVLRTRVGSPFVIAGMERAARDGARIVCGFEANGGFLAGSDSPVGDGAGRKVLPPCRPATRCCRSSRPWRRPGRRACRWPTSWPRSTWARRRATACPIRRPSGAARSCAVSPRRRSAATFFRPSGSRTASTSRTGPDRLDGDRTIHFRASGNAPELRCYAEAKSARDAEELVRWGLAAAAAAMDRTA